MRATLAFTALCGFALLACDPGDAPPIVPEGGAPGAARGGGGVDYVFDPASPMKHAYRGPREATALKGDGLDPDEIRFFAPERYAITGPPVGVAALRPMVEWEPMRALVMSFPGSMSYATGAATTMIDIAYHASQVAEIWFVVDSEPARAFIEQELLDAGLTAAELGEQVRFVEDSLDSVWFIDSGPLPIVDASDGSWAFADFRYYHDRARDDGIPTWLGRQLPSLGLSGPAPTYRLPLSFEGGTFQATTDGICFTGNRQLYNMSCFDKGCDASIRWAPLDEIQTHPYAQQLRELWSAYLGCTDVVVTNSITDDGTGHIDMYMKVASDSLIIVGEYEEPYEDFDPQVTAMQEQNAARLDANAAFLAAYVRPGGGGFTVERLPMPGHRTSSYGPMPFTYLNSTFVNGLNLWPAFTFPDWEASRAAAEARWQEILPDMEHVWLDSEELSFWSGAIHCVTRTIPAGEPALWIPDGTCGADGLCAAPAGGYAGECTPGPSVTETCWGPEWLCDCNDCDSTCEPPASIISEDCAGVTEVGCCQGSSKVRRCLGELLLEEGCGLLGCGWDEAAAAYACGSQGQDPSGAHHPACAVARGECAPDCGGRVCGDDGCGGSCGGCPSGELCDATAGSCAPCGDGCTPGEKGCDGTVPFSCKKNKKGCPIRYDATDCAASGQVCEAGVCVSPGAEPEPEPGADAAEAPPVEDVAPRIDIAARAEVGPEIAAADVGTDVGADATSGPTPARKKKSGCHGSPGAGWAWLAVAAWLLARVSGPAGGRRVSGRAPRGPCASTPRR